MSDFNRDNNRAVWFDIPVVDLERATSFYSEVLAVKVEKQSFEDFQFSVIEHRDGNGGCLVPNPDEVSSDKGILLYLQRPRSDTRCRTEGPRQRRQRFTSSAFNRSSRV